MTPEQFERIEALFHQVRGLPAEQRQTLLATAATDEPALRVEVEKLLAHARPEETLADLRETIARAVRPAAAWPAAHERHGDGGIGPRIEGYEITHEIHRGGQGVVYQAIQKSTKRKVAIKLLLQGAYASKSAQRRFEREIELVARFKHPNIISIFDSGRTAEGHMYCVMDYVRGQRLDAYVRSQKLAMEGALQLFAVVCDAVQYAHGKGVIHRDLKPSNVLVDSDGLPKVLDFGLAKQLTDREPSVLSLTGQVVGTLPYMSPEQAEGNPDKIDIRTDVYALGVILYELLTGQRPYDLTHVKPHQAARMICDATPRRPSAIIRTLRGDLETITLKALEKEASRRYQSAAALSEDIQRYLADQPILARPPSAAYQFRKLVARHKAPFAFILAMFALVTGFGVWMSVLYREQSLARQDAIRERNRALAAEQEQIRERRRADELRQRAEEESERANRLVGKARQALIKDMRQAILLLDVHGLDRMLASAKEVELEPSDLACYQAWRDVLHFDFQPALARLDEALRLDPRNADAYYLRAGIFGFLREFPKSWADLGRARALSTDSHFSVINRALIQVLTDNFSDALVTLEELKPFPDTSMSLWVTGFCRWLQLFYHAPRRLEERAVLASQALEDVGLAAEVYRSVPMVFDVKTDIHLRMALIQRAMGDAQQFSAHLRLAENAAEVLASLGQPGVQQLYLAEVELWRHGPDAAVPYVDRAFELLTGKGNARLINISNHLSAVVAYRIGLYWALGRDEDAMNLIREAEQRFPQLEFGTVAGFVRGHAGSEDWSDWKDAGDLWSRQFGLWAGLHMRGDAQRARAVADRMQSGLLSQISRNWEWKMTQFVQGRADDKQLMRWAESNGNNLSHALLALAIASDSPERRATYLNDIAGLGVSNIYSKWAEWIRFRIIAKSSTSVTSDDGP